MVEQRDQRVERYELRKKARNSPEGTICDKMRSQGGGWEEILQPLDRMLQPLPLFYDHAFKVVSVWNVNAVQPTVQTLWIREVGKFEPRCVAALIFLFSAVPGVGHCFIEQDFRLYSVNCTTVMARRILQRRHLNLNSFASRCLKMRLQRMADELVMTKNSQWSSDYTPCESREPSERLHFRTRTASPASDQWPPASLRSRSAKKTFGNAIRTSYSDIHWSRPYGFLLFA